MLGFNSCNIDFEKNILHSCDRRKSFIFFESINTLEKHGSKAGPGSQICRNPEYLMSVLPAETEEVFFCCLFVSALI